ncbi:MAG: metallophosphoesterase family protein [Capnocytophaga sp.]|nr:metallophosphoesterase family protein [Capnocytophaga sp.]
MKILLLSDTHSYIDDKILAHASQVDEVWHCGDFGSANVAKALAEIKPLRGVYGNIDGTDIRSQFPEVNRFFCEEVEVLMIHIGGYPNKYSALAKQEITSRTPKIFISGHSHILKVMYDKNFQLLHLNPGAVGKHGWQTVRTMIRFEIDKKDIKNIEIIEFPR